MANPSYPPVVPATEKKGCGCFGIGCGISVLALLIVIAGGCFLGYWIFNYIKGFTSEQPQEIAVVTGTEEEWTALREKVATFSANSKAGRSSTLELSDREINILIDRHPDFAAIKNRAFVYIADGFLNAKVSIPLTEVPGFSGRYLNGDAKLKIDIADGALQVKAQELKVGDMTAPAELLKRLEEEFSTKLTQDPQARESLEKFKSIKFEGNSLIIESKAGPSAMPEVPPTPEEVEAGPKSPETATPPAPQDPPTP